MADPDQDTVQTIVDSRPYGDVTPKEVAASSSKRQSSPLIPPLPQFSPTPQLRQYDAPAPSQYGLAPNQQQGTPFDAFKDPMLVLAGLSSLFTRHPLMGAMNYAAGAMKGYRAGQNEVFEQNKEKFDQALKAATEQNRVELNRYQANWDWKKNADFAKAIPGLWTEAVQNNDQLMMAAIRSGDPNIVFKVLEGRDAVRNQFDRAFQVQDARQQAQDAEVDRLKQDPGVIGQADDIIAYRKPLPPLARNNPRNQAINELVTERSAASGDPYDTAQFAARNKFVTGLGSTTVGSSGGQINSAKIVVRHLATLDKLIDDLGTDTNTATFRRAAQAVQTEFGLSSAPTNFDAAVGLVAGEIIKLVEGSGGTGEDRNRVVNAFNRANSAPLLHDAVDVAREVMSARVDSLAEQAKGARAESTFNRYLPPDVRRLLEPRRGAGPQVGTVQDGYRFKGGNPGDPNNWEKVK